MTHIHVPGVSATRVVLTDAYLAYAITPISGLMIFVAFFTDIASVVHDERHIFIVIHEHLSIPFIACTR